jgi:hypothetical protein
VGEADGEGDAAAVDGEADGEADREADGEGLAGPAEDGEADAPAVAAAASGSASAVAEHPETAKAEAASRAPPAMNGMERRNADTALSLRSRRPLPLKQVSPGL